MFTGSITALVTPFRDGRVDEEALRRLVEFQIANGSDGLVPCGTTGESATLSYEEHDRVIELTIEAAAGRVPVIAGTGSNSTAETIALTKHAESAGAKAALLITPYYNKPTQQGLYEHYRKVAEEVSIPVILYNVPGRTSVNMLPETTARLSELKNIVGIKEATGDLKQVSDTIEFSKEGFIVLSGDDFTTLPLLAIGGHGVISVTSNVVPGMVSDMIRAFRQGDLARARDLHYRLEPLNRAMFIETNPVPVKTALSMMGMIGPEMRLPLVGMKDENRERLASVLDGFGLLAKGARR
ncbi:MAG: 4-hydroxy-tetrahydrodipicolinate synthase [Deltaproteobacteria bacterium]|nr:4-hydroxy-tetrahydrodipicolinate synthase [Deltaproteobacteria bacterium]MCL4873414.1 4-hydroxy-tetrahydrodipicolinate synthase [bacterium]